MTTPAELNYPVLALGPEGFAYTVGDEVTLRSGRALAIDRGYFEKLRVIDPRGALYRVTFVRDARIAPGEWLGRILGRFANPRMRVQLEMEQERILTLDEVKEEVRDGIRRLAEVHDEAPGGTRYLLSRVKRAASIPDLLECFKGLV